MNDKLTFGKKNYILMITGVVLLFLGYYIMTLDKEPYGFGMLGLTIGPLTVIAGLVVEFFAIIHKPKKDNE